MDVLQTAGKHAPMIVDSRPFTRWWWFSGPIPCDAVDSQLDWLAANGFGGVEIAWVYPLAGTGADTGPKFLDEEFIACLSYAVEGCRSRNLGCDLTYGTLWPFNGTFIPPDHAAMTLSGLSRQRAARSWEARYSREPAKILNHLNPRSLRWYAEYLKSHGFTQLAEKTPMSFFCDSWEVEPVNLGYDGLFEDFLAFCGCPLAPHAEKLNDDADIRFDYRHIISERVLDAFYRPYVELCHEAGALARVQCHGAPTDILAAYALCDIPETETLLFDPDFALLSSSAAAVTGKPVVSSESFSCLYGWVPAPGPPPGLGEELIDDLRCIADAQFAWGVNRVVWHGKPFSTPDHPSRFYASVHVGPEGKLAPHFPSFNGYLSTVSSWLGQGETVSNMAVYLPLEDQWMRDRLPDDLLKPSSSWYWELQELHIQDHLLPYRPLWFSSAWLEDLHSDRGKLICRGRDIGVLYCDSRWMLLSSVRRLAILLKQGAPIIFNRWPKEPGKVKHAEYDQLVRQMKNLGSFQLEKARPVVTTSIPVDFWCREDEDCWYLFFSHPQMRRLRYPLPYGYSAEMQEYSVETVVHHPAGDIAIHLNFGKCESLLFRIDGLSGTVSQIRLPEVV